MSKLIEDLDEEVERKARHFLLAVHDAGLSIAVTSTMRTREEQVAYWAQGRGNLELVNLLRKIAGMKPIPQSENHIISNTDGVNKLSKHQSGRAMDVVLLNKYGESCWHISAMLGDYKEMGRIAKASGFEWGGTWEPIDPVTGVGWDAFHLQG
jgi:hypothetical protein